MAEQFKWWEEHDAHYEANIEKWRFTRDVYECDATVIRKPGKFIIRREQGESEKNYAERLSLAKPVALLAAIADGYRGRVGLSEDRITRNLGPHIGAPNEKGTLAHSMWRNVDGRGENYLPMLSCVATELVLMQEVWGIVDGTRKDGDGKRISDPTIRYLPVEDVPITIEDDHGHIIAAVVKHTKKVRPTVFDQPTAERRYTIYGIDGYATYRINDKEEAERVDGGQGTDMTPYAPKFSYWATPDRQEKTLPIFRVRMPGKRNPAFNLAHQNVTYINHASELQNKHRSCNILKMQLVADDKDQQDQQVEAIKAGFAVQWVHSAASRDNKYIEPSGASLAESRQWLAESRGEILISALREYEDSVRGVQKTATEAEQDSMGEHSYLNALAQALDEYEAQSWYRVEQIEYPTEPGRWGQVEVERSRDFKPLDQGEISDRLRKTFFGPDAVPVGRTGQINAAKAIADSEGVEADEAEIEAEVDKIRATREQFDDVLVGAGV